MLHSSARLGPWKDLVLEAWRAWQEGERVGAYRRYGMAAMLGYPMAAANAAHVSAYLPMQFFAKECQGESPEEGGIHCNSDQPTKSKSMFEVLAAWHGDPVSLRRLGQKWFESAVSVCRKPQDYKAMVGVGEWKVQLPYWLSSSLEQLKLLLGDGLPCQSRVHVADKLQNSLMALSLAGDDTESLLLQG